MGSAVDLMKPALTVFLFEMPGVFSIALLQPGGVFLRDVKYVLHHYPLVILV